jgi:hypothetical protein
LLFKPDGLWWNFSFLISVGTAHPTGRLFGLFRLEIGAKISFLAQKGGGGKFSKKLFLILTQVYYVI